MSSAVHGGGFVVIIVHGDTGHHTAVFRLIMVETHDGPVLVVGDVHRSFEFLLELCIHLK